MRIFEKIAIQKLGIIPLEKNYHTQTNVKSDIIQRFAYLIYLGYKPKSSFYKFICEATSMEFNDVYDILKEIKGINKNWNNTLFPNFRDYVQNTPEIILRFETLLHYYTTYGLELEEPFSPNKEISKEPKEITFEEIAEELPKELKSAIKFKSLDIGCDEDISNKLVLSILYTKSPLTGIEKEYIEDYDTVEYVNTLDIDCKNIKFNEIKGYLLENLTKVDKLKNFRPNDALRFILNKIDENNNYMILKRKSLFDKAEDVSLDFKEIENFWEILETCKIHDILVDYKQKRKLWNLIIALSKNQFDKNLIRCNKYQYLKKVKNNPKKYLAMVKTKYGLFEKKIKDILDVNGFKELVKNDPGLFVEYFSRIFVKCKGKVFDAFDEIVVFLNLKQKLRLYNYVSYIMNKKNDKWIFVMPHTIQYKEYKHPLQNVRKRDLKILLDTLKESIVKNIEKINISKSLKMIKFPLTVRSTGDGDNYEVGSAIPIDLTDNQSIILRSGVYWENCNGNRIDLDLSASFYNEDLDNSSQIGWDSDYSNDCTIFSGDVTDGRNGAAEFIDFELSKVDLKKQRYALIGLHNYTEDDCSFKFGFQLTDEKYVEKKGSAGKYFKPNRMTYQANDVFNTGSPRKFIAVIDFKEMLFYPLNLTIPGMRCSTSSNDESKQYIMNMILNVWNNKFEISEINDNDSEKVIEENRELFEYFKTEVLK